VNPDLVKLMSVSTDFPLDKVVYMHTRTVVISGFSFNDQIFAHNLPFTPLILGQWSFDSNFDTAYDANSGPRFGGGGTLLFASALHSDATNITIFNTNNQASSVTVYWRIYGIMPSTVSTTAPFTASTADDYIVDTDQNYSKLFLSGETGFSSTLGSSVVVQHGLGYRPQVLVWTENSTFTTWTGSYALEGTGGGGNNRCRVGTQEITLIRDSTVLPSSTRFHYRIYIDE
jgi:hypothetical protein